MALEIDIADSLSADRITRYLDRLTHYHGYPLKIQVNNGQNLPPTDSQAGQNPWNKLRLH